MAFENNIVPYDCGTGGIVPLDKGRRVKLERKRKGQISLLSLAGKIYLEVIMNNIHRVNEGIINDDKEDLPKGGSVYMRPLL